MKTITFDTDWKEIRTIQDFEIFGGKFVLMKNLPPAWVGREYWTPSFADEGMVVVRIRMGLVPYHVNKKMDRDFGGYGIETDILGRPDADLGKVAILPSTLIATPLMHVRFLSENEQLEVLAVLEERKCSAYGFGDISLAQWRAALLNTGAIPVQRVRDKTVRYAYKTGKDYSEQFHSNPKIYNKTTVILTIDSTPVSVDFFDMTHPQWMAAYYFCVDDEWYVMPFHFHPLENRLTEDEQLTI